MNTSDDPRLADLQGVSPSKPCCSGCAETAAESSLPSPEALQGELTAFLARSGPGQDDLAFSLFDTDLALADELDLGETPAATDLSLDDVVALAERYPGLKITLSF